MKRPFFLILVLVALAGFSRLGRADEIRNDGTQGLEKKSSETAFRKDDVRSWFDSMGIDTKGDGFAKDMYHLMSGIDEPLSPTANFTVSAGAGLHMGLTF